ncbi:MAG: hypothetical protein LUG90_00875 [Clostridiaceae bacterium]|nr:hypothetical protein [Clostridiaceae bacterium]
MSKRILFKSMKQKNNKNHRSHIEIASSQKLRTCRSFLRVNSNVYEKCRHFRRG